MYLSKSAVRLFDPKVAAMLAEIFMVRLEAEARLVEEVLPSRTSRFIPFSLKRQFGFKDGPQGQRSSQANSGLSEWSNSD